VWRGDLYEEIDGGGGWSEDWREINGGRLAGVEEVEAGLMRPPPWPWPRSTSA
jgi:hypothetical protein